VESIVKRGVWGRVATTSEYWYEWHVVAFCNISDTYVCAANGVTVRVMSGVKARVARVCDSKLSDTYGCFATGVPERSEGAERG
jgi:hypothetical protein